LGKILVERSLGGGGTSLTRGEYPRGGLAGEFKSRRYNRTTMTQRIIQMNKSTDTTARTLIKRSVCSELPVVEDPVEAAVALLLVVDELEEIVFPVEIVLPFVVEV